MAQPWWGRGDCAEVAGSALGEAAHLSGQEWECTVQRGWPAPVEVGALPRVPQSAPELAPSLGPPLFQGIPG